MNKPVVILQARMASSRLPGKVMLNINGHPMIYWQIRRIQKSKNIGRIVVATSNHESDDLLANYLKSMSVDIFRGQLLDVHSRYLAILKNLPNFKSAIRLTADCPFVMPELIDQMVSIFDKKNCDYFSNTIKPTFPDGLDIEIFNSNSFIENSKRHLTASELEHVTLHLRNKDSNLKILSHESEVDLSHLRWTVDYPQDFEFVKGIFSKFVGVETEFDTVDLLKMLMKHPELNLMLPGNLRNIAISDEGKIK
jgi:spore coat polysaccharide biosynthesis protein SpsF